MAAVPIAKELGDALSRIANTDYSNERITKSLPNWSRAYLAETIRADETGQMDTVPNLIHKQNLEPYVYGAPSLSSDGSFSSWRLSS